MKYVLFVGVTQKKKKKTKTHRTEFLFAPENTRGKNITKKKVTNKKH